MTRPRIARPRVARSSVASIGSPRSASGWCGGPTSHASSTTGYDAGRVGNDRRGANMTAKRPRIALLAAPETSASVLYGLYDVLLSVGAVYPDMTTGEAGDALLDVSIVGATKEPFRCFGNILVEPHHGIDDIGPVDVA